MSALRKLHLDLEACELEDRLLPVIANVGVIVLTTSGYVLTLPSPGASANAGGTALPTSFFMTGAGGISGIQPGNPTGVAGLAVTAAAGSSGGTGGTVVLSGANDPDAVSISLVTRNTIANDALNAAPRIGGPSGDRSPVLPAGQIYRGGVPAPVPVPPPSGILGEQSSRSPVESAPIRPVGAPARLPWEISGNLMTARADRGP